MNDFDKLIHIIDVKVGFGIKQNNHENQYFKVIKKIVIENFRKLSVQDSYQNNILIRTVIYCYRTYGLSRTI